MKELLEKKENIRIFVVETFLFDDPDAAIDDDESLLDAGIIDSTGVLELVAFIEDEYDIVVKDEELIPDNLDSINKIAAYVDKKM
jgi:acyl carrier protein